MSILDVITKANPYTGSGSGATSGPTYPPDANLVIEQQLEVGTWGFKGVPHYIEKAIRIPYTYTDVNGVTIRDYLLIGYEGGGAY